jgi:outer membrane receptor protein involved in Fe transport
MSIFGPIRAKAAVAAIILSGSALLAPVASAQIEEVVVTAERRAESLQDVSVSVSAFDEEALELGGINDVSRLELLVPGLNYAFAGNDAKFNVRGANSTNTFGDNSSIVGAFVDGVYQARASQQTRAFFDVQRVEFLRGPQGTLYGRNTFAGALNVFTNTPQLSDGIGGNVNLAFMRFDRIRAEGALNLPFSDTFGIRIAGFTDKSDGYIENIAGPDMGAQDDRGARISALWAPSDRLEIIGRFTYIEEDGLEAGLFGYTFNCRNETPEGVTDPFGSERNCSNPIRGSAVDGQAQGIASNGPNGNPWKVAQDYVRPVDLTDTTASLTIRYDWDAVSLTSITAGNDYTNDINFDFDFSQSPHSNGGYLEESQGWSQELQLTSNGDGRLQWTAGVYYSELEDYSSFYIYNQTQREPDDSRPSVTIPQGTFTVLQATNILSRETSLNGFFANAVLIDTDYFGAYAQGDFSLTDRFRLIAGVRYNDEEKSASCGGSNFSAGDRVVNVVDGVDGASPLILPTNASDLFTYNCDAADAETSPSPAAFDNVTWRLGAEWDVTDSIMTYVTASTGYLSGSTSTAATTDEQESQVIELGFRSVIANDRLQFNGAFHLTEYTNLLTQQQRIIAGIADTFSTNGGDIEAYGVELDAVWLPTDNLTFTGTFAYLKSEFGEFGQQNPYQLYRGQVLENNFVNQNGEVTPWSPEITFGASAAYFIDMGSAGTLQPYVQFYYSDGYNTSNLLATDPAHDQDSFSKTDARLIWTSVDGGYSIEGFIENIEDADVLARGNNNSDDIVQTSYLYPQNYGVRLRVFF